MSTDDYFRLGALGRDPAGAGYDTGCVTDGVTGQNGDLFMSLSTI